MSGDTNGEADGKSTPIQVARGLYNFLRVVGGTQYERSALVADLSIGLAMLIQRKEREREQQWAQWVAQLQREHVELDAVELKRLHHFAQLAHGAYSANEDELYAHTPVYAKMLRKARWSSSQDEPAYYITIDDLSQSIVLAIRGTDTVSDVFTDLSLHPTPFLSGMAHAGMTRAALRLYEEVHETLRQALATHPQYDLVFTGHSLGGGVASILAMKLLWERETSLGLFEGRQPPRLRAYAFGTPACISSELVQQVQDSPADLRDALVTVVLGDDLVPRASAASIDRVVRELAAFNWREQITSELTEYMNTSALMRWSQQVLRWSVQREQVQRFVSEIGERLSRASSSLKSARLGNTFGLVAAAAGSASGWMNWYSGLFQSEHRSDAEKRETSLVDPITLPQFYPPGGRIWHLHAVRSPKTDRTVEEDNFDSANGRARRQFVQDISSIGHELWNEMPIGKGRLSSDDATSDNTSAGMTSDASANPAGTEPQRMLLQQVTPCTFHDIVLSRQCLNDHLMRNIRRALAKLYEQEHASSR
ncbi:hypothetical protein CCYA_CCYA13G3527 [Cyanidiococcus yangmingshanensis]|nr:hypothetical protein CCYA_CCYA13G3527 [Cyanidiococcus yangmingshanensis]